jgi:hypothetical protein
MHGRNVPVTSPEDNDNPWFTNFGSSRCLTLSLESKKKLAREFRSSEGSVPLWLAEADEEVTEPQDDEDAESSCSLKLFNARSRRRHMSAFQMEFHETACDDCEYAVMRSLHEYDFSADEKLLSQGPRIPCSLEESRPVRTLWAKLPPKLRALLNSSSDKIPEVFRRMRGIVESD